MLFLPTAWTLSTGLSTEAEILRLWNTSVPIISETSEGCKLGWADGMLPLPAARTYEEGLPPETRIPILGLVQSQSAVGQEQLQFVSPYPSMGQRDQYQSEDATPALSTLRTGHIGRGQSVGRGRPQDLQVESSGQAWQMTCYHCRQPGHMRRDCPRRQRSHGTETERSD